jgi:hypothetical protein
MGFCTYCGCKQHGECPHLMASYSHGVKSVCNQALYQSPLLMKYEYVNESKRSKGVTLFQGQRDLQLFRVDFARRR